MQLVKRTRAAEIDRSRPSRPAGLPIMRQNWRELLFAHWEWDPDEVQRSLPAGLAVDCFEGRAYLGIIPFFMVDVRPSGLPAIPWLSDFLEMNVRTYVVDPEGRPGVWFYSLDCNRPFAVVGARRLFHLRYEHARMKAQIGPESAVVYYDCKRAGTTHNSHFEWLGAGPATRSEEGSLEQFLVERYRLFSENGGRLFSGRVWHAPYDVGAAELMQWDVEPLRQAGFEAGTLPPDHVMLSPGVDVEVWGLKE
jgi:uncharacterized protein YqjF (DUF2071 family)